MSTPVILLIVLLLIIIFAGIAILFGSPFSNGYSFFDRSQLKSNMGSIVSAQRDSRSPSKSEKRERVTSYEVEQTFKTASSRITLEKRLKFGQWKISPTTFNILCIAISILAFLIIRTKFNILIQLVSLTVGPITMNALLNFKISRRFNAFDLDYSPFLLSLVGLLKTGMNTMGALEAAGRGLEEGSLVREEVELMMERLRFGVSEDKSIGAFGEDIMHPEIELFVQALLLSRRVGGTLSDTLERLSKQVRRRQFFRSSANAAIGMQRGSIWFIIGILVAMEVYLFFVYPEAVTGAIKDPVGWQVWQGGITLVLIGIFWIRQVTKIKV